MFLSSVEVEAVVKIKIEAEVSVTFSPELVKSSKEKN